MVAEVAETAGLSKHRIETLADGVFAIVITLLVLDIKAPVASSDRELLGQLVALWPRFFSYAISFVLIGIFWFGHHMEYHYIRRADRVLIWLTLLLLMCVAFIPFSAAVLGANPFHRTAIAVYGGNLIAAGLARYLHWNYATSGHRLVDREMDERIIKKVGAVFLVVPATYLAAILVSFASVTASLVLFAAIPLLYIRPPREDRNLTSLPAQPPVRAEQKEGAIEHAGSSCNRE